MIHTAKQLKDKVRNISKGDNNIAKTLIRNYMMERFLERVSLSGYYNNFILKGGMLVASIVGVDMHTLKIIDTALEEARDDVLRLDQEYRDAKRYMAEYRHEMDSHEKLQNERLLDQTDRTGVFAAEV